jgi:RimJ/RimL family protein N-acetyltransferase
MIYEAIDGKIAAFTTTLKDGTEIVIREATIQDAADFIRCVKSYISDNEYQVMEADEFAPDLGQGREFIQSFIESENSILLVALHNEKIVGNIDITGGRRKRLRHTGLIGMGMLREYRSKGMGTTLLETAITWAKKNAGLEKIWLQIVAENTPAVQLYKKMGFTEEGRQKQFIRIGKDKYSDNLIMALNVRDADRTGVDN